jgi:hypothetical protein
LRSRLSICSSSRYWMRLILGKTSRIGGQEHHVRYAAAATSP